MTDISTVIGLDEIKLDISHELGVSIHVLYRDLSSVGSWAAIFSPHCRAEIQQETDHVTLCNSNFYRDTREWNVARDELMQLEVVNDLSLRDFDMSERGWHNLVHWPVLHAALDKRDDVEVFDISHVCIFPNDILSAYGVHSEDLSAATVTYAICVNPSDALADRLALALRNEENGTCRLGQSVNPTRYEPLRTRPIGLTIQTQSSRASLSATPPLTPPLWAAAQFERMKALNPQEALPTLPAIVVVGTAWELYFIAPPRRRDGTDVRVYKDDGPPLGDTASLAGAYQLVASLRRLADWVGEDLGGWWGRNLPPTVAGERKRRGW